MPGSPCVSGLCCNEFINYKKMITLDSNGFFVSPRGGVPETRVFPFLRKRVSCERLSLTPGDFLMRLVEKPVRKAWLMCLWSLKPGGSYRKVFKGVSLPPGVLEKQGFPLNRKQVLRIKGSSIKQAICIRTKDFHRKNFDILYTAELKRSKIWIQ